MEEDNVEELMDCLTETWEETTHDLSTTLDPSSSTNNDESIEEQENCSTCILLSEHDSLENDPVLKDSEEIIDALNTSTKIGAEETDSCSLFKHYSLNELSEVPPENIYKITKDENGECILELKEIVVIGKKQTPDQQGLNNIEQWQQLFKLTNENMKGYDRWESVLKPSSELYNKKYGSVSPQKLPWWDRFRDLPYQEHFWGYNPFYAESLIKGKATEKYGPGITFDGINSNFGSKVPAWGAKIMRGIKTSNEWRYWGECYYKFSKMFDSFVSDVMRYINGNSSSQTPETTYDNSKVPVQEINEKKDKVVNKPGNTNATKQTETQNNTSQYEDIYQVHYDINGTDRYILNSKGDTIEKHIFTPNFYDPEEEH